MTRVGAAIWLPLFPLVVACSGSLSMAALSEMGVVREEGWRLATLSAKRLLLKEIPLAYDPGYLVVVRPNALVFSDAILSLGSGALMPSTRYSARSDPDAWVAADGRPFLTMDIPVPLVKSIAVSSDQLCDIVLTSGPKGGPWRLWLRSPGQRPHCQLKCLADTSTTTQLSHRSKARRST